MPAAQTVATQENEAYTGGHGFVCAAEAIEQTPHETEEFLSREQAINELLETLVKEEARQEKCRVRHDKVFKFVFRGGLALGCISVWFLSFPPAFIAPNVAKTIAHVLIWIAMGFSACIQNLNAKITGYGLVDMLCTFGEDESNPKRTPHFSSLVQQNAITALLAYADDPRVAEPLCQAIVYYSGDTNLLYLRLARVLPLLPNNVNALSERSRRILFNVMRGYTSGLLGSDKKRQTLPVLQAAAKEYFARTGEPTPRPKRKWFKRRTNARQKTKEIE